MKLPNFPNFKNLEVSDIPIIQKITSKYEPYSDFNELSLFSNNIDNNTSISLLNGNLIIKMRYYTNSDLIYSVLGKNKIEHTIKKLLELNSHIRLVPEVSVNEITNINGIYDISEDIDNHDYILDLNKISYPDKHKLRNIYRKYTHFKTSYPHYHFKQIDLRDEKTKAEIIDLSLYWRKLKSEQSSTAIFDDTDAILAMFKYIDHFDLYSFGIYMEEKLISFIICSNSSHKKTIMGQFGKSMPDKKGLFATMIIETSKALSNMGYLYMNYEQDLGIQGLRNSKTQYKPIKFLKKYTITLK